MKNANLINSKRRLQTQCVDYSFFNNTDNCTYPSAQYTINNDTNVCCCEWGLYPDKLKDASKCSKDPTPLLPPLGDYGCGNNNTCQKMTTGGNYGRDCSGTGSTCATTQSICNPLTKACDPVAENAEGPKIQWSQCDDFCRGEINSCFDHGRPNITSCVCQPMYQGANCEIYPMNNFTKHLFSDMDGHGKGSDGTQVHALLTLGSFYTSQDTTSLTIRLRFGIRGEGGHNYGVYSFGAMIIDMTEMEKNSDYYNKFSIQPGVLNMINNTSPLELNDHNGAAYNMLRNGMITTPMINAAFQPGYPTSGLPDETTSDGWKNLPWQNRNDTSRFEFDGTLGNSSSVGNSHYAIVAYIGVSTNAFIRIWNDPGESFVQFNH